jgi:hypothetical protein
MSCIGHDYVSLNLLTRKQLDHNAVLLKRKNLLKYIFFVLQHRKKCGDSVDERVLRSFVRVGPLAKGLLLHGDLHIHLVALCAEKPTRTLLDTVVDRLTKQLQVRYQLVYIIYMNHEIKTLMLVQWSDEQLFFVRSPQCDGCFTDLEGLVCVVFVVSSSTHVVTF